MKMTMMTNRLLLADPLTDRISRQPANRKASTCIHIIAYSNHYDIACSFSGTGNMKFYKNMEIITISKVPLANCVNKCKLSLLGQRQELQGYYK
jgi:hypothetical protein